MLYCTGLQRDQPAGKIMEEKKAVRHCRKCLTRDMDWGEYFDNLHAYIAQLDENIKTQESLYEERLLKCRCCDLLMDGMCRACGCYVELRAAVRKNVCPYGKW